MCASLSSLETIHHPLATYCSYWLRPQLFNIAHKKWVVCNIEILEIAMGFKILS
jgi:hypothetical protein